MARKLMGISLLIAVLALAACGNSTSSSDECTDDPKAPGCEVEEDTPAAEE